jgi:hypothetical protein
LGTLHLNHAKEIIWSIEDLQRVSDQYDAFNRARAGRPDWPPAMRPAKIQVSAILG